MADLSAIVSQEYKKYSPVNRTKTGDDLLAGYYKQPLVFTTPPMSDIDYRKINDAYRSLSVAADSNATNDKNACDKFYITDWLPATNLIRIDVNKVANGDKTTVDLSGFHSTKVISIKSVIGEKIDVKGEPGTSGSRTIKYSTKTKMKAKAILVTVAPVSVITTQAGNVITIEIPPSDKPTYITQVLGTAKSGEVSGLTRTQEVNVNMTSVNVAGISPPSNSANVVVP